MEPEIPGLSVEALEGGAIVAYTLLSAQATTISAWSDLAISKLKDWPKDRPYLALHDLSYPGVGLLYLTAVEFDPFNVGVTESGHREVLNLLASNHDWPIVLALVVSTSMSGRLTRLRLADLVSASSEITSRAFFKRSAAVDWLMQHAKSPDKISTNMSEAVGEATITAATTLVSTLPTSVMGITPVETTATVPTTVAPTPDAEVLTPNSDASGSVAMTVNSSEEVKPLRNL